MHGLDIGGAAVHRPLRGGALSVLDGADAFEDRVEKLAELRVGGVRDDEHAAGLEVFAQGRHVDLPDEPRVPVEERRDDDDVEAVAAERGEELREGLGRVLVADGFDPQLRKGRVELVSVASGSVLENGDAVGAGARRAKRGERQRNAECGVRNAE
ncbi:MAG: hypothetical protein IJQ73_10795 [Kiritimatiellae bacterium]|nr:hypothetical protein [Kiritimatiellia bacterium]